MADPTSFLNGRVTLHAGDCLAVLPTLAESSVDSVVTDPPYHLASIVKRWSGKGPPPVEGVYRRSTLGFMGKAWDGGDVAFDPATWAAVLRVMKPGAHLVAFAAPKNSHRLACAIEDAGFEIRDTLCWLFGQGFPKSHNITNKIGDNFACQLSSYVNGAARKLRHFQVVLSEGKIGFAAASVAIQQEVGHGRKTVIGVVVASSDPMDISLYESTEKIDLNTILSLNKRLDDLSREKSNAITLMELKTIIDLKIWHLLQFQNTLESTTVINHTALKPAYEPIILARKPLSEPTIAANVLKHGVGAINIAACRVETEEAITTHSRGANGAFPKRPGEHSAEESGRIADQRVGLDTTNARSGRWPANVILSDDEEVQSVFPETSSGALLSGHGSGNSFGIGNEDKKPRPIINGNYGNDAGSAARFFYTAKADANDRIGSKHPTVKPLDLMQYLVRLVTPPKGIVLDCFAGTGTTAEAAWREGFSAILIEREAEYLADIERRMGLCLAGPDERARESIKARLKGKPEDHGPLFSTPSLFDEAAE